MERPWGGFRLAGEMAKPQPTGSNGPFGESWELSDHPAARSTIAAGRFHDTTFGALLRRHPEEMVGRSSPPEVYPLLLKVLDAAEDLSLQVHPDDHHAEVLHTGERGKTESWYFLDAAHQQRVIYGVAEGVDARGLRQAIEERRIDEAVARHDVGPGTFLHIPAGTVHALLGGSTICELQQTSDTTYRLWDWDRKPARPLHLDKGLAVASFPHPEGRVHLPPRPFTPGKVFTLTDNIYYRWRAMDLVERQQSILPECQKTGVILFCVTGVVRVNGPDGGCDMGEFSTAYLPAICEGATLLEAVGGPARLLIAESKEL